MLVHLAATERCYQTHTFEVRKWGDLDKKGTDMWEVGSQLVERPRNEIKGNPISFFTDKLEAVREKTKEELKKRDDSWLMESIKFFANQLTNK